MSVLPTNLASAAAALDPVQRQASRDAKVKARARLTDPRGNDVVEVLVKSPDGAERGDASNPDGKGTAQYAPKHEPAPKPDQPSLDVSG